MFEVIGKITVGILGLLGFGAAAMEVAYRIARGHVRRKYGGF